ncbi:hypothetical protein ACTXT7_014408 [Hymenolepis weldensis]
MLLVRDRKKRLYSINDIANNELELGSLPHWTNHTSARRVMGKVAYRDILIFRSSDREVCGETVASRNFYGLNDLKTRFQEARAAIMPKRRFKFGAGASKKVSPQFTASDNVSIKTNTLPRKPAATSHPTIIPSEFSLSGLSNRHDLRLPANDGDSNKDSLRDQSLCLTDLTDCKVCITSSCGNLMVSHLSKCVIKILRPVGSSVMLQDCVDCRFVLACRQLRVHRTRGSRFDVFVASAPIIEDSSDLLVGPWNVGGDERFSSVLGDKNHWKEVQDFSCPTLVAEKASESPNWSLLPMDEWLEGEEL